MRTCLDCPASIEDRPAQARLCENCKAKRRRAKFRRYDRKNRAKRRKAARANQERNREAVRKYSRTEKGQAARERAEAKPSRRNYKRQWKRDNPQPIFLRCPDDWIFEAWIDRIIQDPPKPLPVLDSEPHPWQDFVVPGYLK